MYHREGQHFIRGRRGRRAIWWRRAMFWLWAIWWWRAREKRRKAMGKRRRRVNSGWGLGCLELSTDECGEFEGEL